jgi:hypothetical protein
MKGISALSCLIGIVALLLAPQQARAQTGVFGGPPQVQPGQPSAAQRPTPAEPSSVTWIAVVGGFDGSGRRVSVGYSGYRDSRRDAEESALQACRGNDSRAVCKDPFAVSTGCLFIVWGERRGGVSWGRGATRDLALQQCRRGGYVCQTSKIIGGCLPGYN